MKITKKTLAIFICVPLILLACVSCGNDSAEIDYSKFSICTDTTTHHKTPDDQEEFDLYLNNFMSQARYYAEDGYDYIWITVYVKGDEAEDAESDRSGKKYLGIDHEDAQIKLKIKLEDVDREVIKKLALNDEIEKVVLDLAPVL